MTALLGLAMLVAIAAVLWLRSRRHRAASLNRTYRRALRDQRYEHRWKP